MNNKRKIAIYPGFFNPFHKQHAKIIDCLIERTDVAKIYIFINAKTWQKTNIIPWTSRFKIIHTLYQNQAKVIVARKPAPYITNQLFEQITTLHKNQSDQTYLVIGSDNWNRLPTWSEGRTLCQKTNFFVAERAGHPIQTKLKLDWNITMEKITLIPNQTASTAIRNGLNWHQLHPATRQLLWSKRYYLTKILQQHLIPAKYQHVKRVYAVALNLKRRFNLQLKSDWIYFACLFHDLSKNWSRAQHLQFYRKHQLDSQPLLALPFAVWHSKTSAWYLNKELLYDQPAVFEAIANHTTAQPKMSILAKLLFIADKIEPRKQTNNAANLRQLIATTTFDQLFRLTLTAVITELTAKQHVLTPATIAAAKYYLADQ